MATIEAVFMDFDGVLTTAKTGSEVTFRHIYRELGGPQQLGMSFDEFYGHYQPLMKPSELGELTDEQMLQKFEETSGIHIHAGLMNGGYLETPMDNRMYGLAQQLQGQVKVGMITDNPLTRLESLSRFYEFGKTFDPLVVSAAPDVQSSKKCASGTIFQIACERAQVDPGKSYFIDNSTGNVDMARQAGLIAHHFNDETRDYDALETELRSYGLDV